MYAGGQPSGAYSRQLLKRSPVSETIEDKNTRVVISTNERSDGDGDDLSAGAISSNNSRSNVYGDDGLLACP